MLSRFVERSVTGGFRNAARVCGAPPPGRAGLNGVSRPRDWVREDVESLGRAAGATGRIPHAVCAPPPNAHEPSFVDGLCHTGHGHGNMYSVISDCVAQIICHAIIDALFHVLQRFLCLLVYHFHTFWLLSFVLSNKKCSVEVRIISQQ